MDRLKLQLNRPAPRFALTDHRGQPFVLADRLGSPLVLVFFRGHWCPYCRRYLGKLQRHLSRFSAVSATLAAISPEPPSTSSTLVHDLALGFPILSDPDGRVIDLYGVRNGFGACPTLLPHPAVFVLDAAGILRFASVDRNYKKRASVRRILAALAEVHLPTPT